MDTIKINDRFKHLVIIKQLTEKRWLCKCDCGKTIELCNSVWKKRHSCGCLRPQNLSNKEQALNILWSRYKIKAKKRDIEFDLSKSEFESFVFSSCTYCGQLPSTPVNSRNKELARYNGIDRIDSNKPYTVDNCKTCCWICNRAKGNLSVEQYLKWLKQAYTHQFKCLVEKTPAVLVDELATTVIKCFMAQENIMNAPEDSKEALTAAKQAQNLNAQRNKLIRSIDTLLDFEEDTPSEKSYA